MAMAVQCQHCGQRYAVREDLLGKQMKCKACGQTTTLAAAAVPAKTAAAGSSKSASAAGPAATSAKAAAPPVAVPRPKQSAVAKPQQPAAKAAPTKAAAAGIAAAPTDDPLFAPSSNMLDLLGDAALPPAAGMPLSSGVLLKPSAPAPPAKPKAKKKKKKKQSGEKSENAQVLMRMAGGACVVLLGLGAIGMGIYALVGDEDNINPFRFVRWVIFGVGLIGTGLKFIVG